MNSKRCSIWYCFRKVWRYLQLDIAGHKEHIPYCEKHAKLADELFKDGEIKTKIPLDYTTLDDQKN